MDYKVVLTSDIKAGLKIIIHELQDYENKMK